MSIAEHDIDATLQELAEEFGLTPEEQRSFLGAEMNYASSAIRSTGMTQKTTSPSDVRGKVTRIPASFSGKLASDKQQLVRNLYPDFEITFKQEKVQAHAVAACTRMLDRLLLKKRAPAGQKVVSVGGNYEYELVNSSTLVHCCTPDYRLVADAKEAAREVQRNMRLRAMAAGKGCTPEIAARVKAFLSTDASPWRCHNLVQDCRHEAGVIIMSHVYDMSLEEVVRAMISHNSQVVLGCVLFSNDMLVNDHGRLPGVDGYYHIRNGRITYGFEHESQWEYSHDWAKLRRFGFGGAVVQVGTRRAFYSITEKRGDTLFFTMTLAPTAKVCAVPVTKTWRNDDGKRAVVRGYKLSDVDRSTVERALVPEVFSYPYDAFAKCLTYAVERMEKGSFSLEDLQRKVRAVSADTTINSVRVTGFHKLDDEQMAYFLSNVGVLAALSVHKVTSDEYVLLEGVKVVRGNLRQSLTEKTKAAAIKFFSQPFSNQSAVYKFTRNMARAFSATEDRILAGISWEVDLGYRTAVEKPPFTLLGRLPLEDPSGNLVHRPLEHDELIAILKSAADDSEDFAVVMAEAAAAVSLDPRVEQWLTNLRAKYKTKVDVEARRADRAATRRAEDPDCTTHEASTTIVEDIATNAADSSSEPEGAVSGDGDTEALSKAKVLGVLLDPTDELSYETRSVGEYEAVANAAITEAIYLIEAEETKLLGECAKNFEQVSHKGLPCSTQLRNHAKLNFEPDFWVVNADGCLDVKSWLGRTVAEEERFFPYAAVYVPDLAVIIRVTSRLESASGCKYRHYVFGERGQPISGTVMTTSQLEVYNGPVVISNMRNAMKLNLHEDFSLSFIEGVPGCGKTHYIIHSVKPADSVIACGRENADTTRDRIIEFSSAHADSPEFKKPTRGVRTLDSALMFPTAERTGTMFLDECFQDHAGKFWAVIKLWRAKSVQALGDRQQIPYIDRNYTNRCVMPRLSSWSLRVGKYVSRRCPRDATMAIAGFYGWKIRTTSTVTSSLQLKLDTAVVPNLPGWKYLTMYQDDKQNLLRRGFVGVNTVAEVQGQTYERVALVRIQERDMPLFSLREQVDVALSRHTVSFVYYAPDNRNDMLTKLVNEAKGNLSLVDKYGDVNSAGKPIFDI